MAKLWWILAVLLYVVAAAGALWSPSSDAPDVGGSPPAGPASASQPASKAPPPAEPQRETTEQMVGFAINFHHTDKIDRYLAAVDEMADMGVTSLEIVTPAFQRDGAAEEIRITVGPGLSPKREDLVKLLKHAKAKGMTTKLMPIVLFSQPRGNEWRGKIKPENWDKWWASYARMLDYFIDIANETGVSVFSVGSELLSTEKFGDRWTPIITHARERFGGRLSYSTNWDHYEVPVFWKQLDLIGINGYWDLTTRAADKQSPRDEELRTRWREIRDKVLAFGAAQNRPVLLTEIGYPTLPWALKDPWNYVSSGDVAPDPIPQRRAYEAFLDTWDDMLRRNQNPRRAAGVFFYSWDVDRHGDDKDTGYGVRGKPTYDVIKQWLKRRGQSE